MKIWMASSVPLVKTNCSGLTPKKSATARRASPYSGYTARFAGSRPFFSASITRGEQPTVFSLKSRRSLPSRPAVGGEYGAMSITACRGFTAPLGSRGRLATPHLHAPRVRFQSLGPRQGRDRGSQRRQSSRAQLLYRNHLDVIQNGKTAAHARRAARGEDVIGAGSVIPRRLRAVRSHKHRSRVRDGVEP